MYLTRDLTVFSHPNKRGENQDAACHLTRSNAPDESAIDAAFVIDGVASANGGQASEIAQAYLRDRLELLCTQRTVLRQMEETEREQAIHHTLIQSLLSLDRQLLRCQIPTCCTASLAVVFGEKVYTANVGDSPIAMIRLTDDGMALEYLYESHNQAGQLVRNGVLTLQQARTAPEQHLLLRSLGSIGLRAQDIYTTSTWLGQSNLLLLGSDGALSVLQDDKLLELVDQHLDNGVSSFAEALFRAVQNTDSTDNFTIVAQLLDSN